MMVASTDRCHECTKAQADYPDIIKDGHVVTVLCGTCWGRKHGVAGVVGILGSYEFQQTGPRKPFQKCPVCEGRQTMPCSFYEGPVEGLPGMPDDTKCRTCDGKGMVGDG